jgi:hypothetical protein
MICQGAMIIAGSLKGDTNWAPIFLQRGNEAVEVIQLVEDG